MSEPLPAVGAVVTDSDGRLLLVKRGRPPQVGRWSIPGGKVEDGEGFRAAVVREVREETGLEVEPAELLGFVERTDEGYHYVILDFAAHLVPPASAPLLLAGDDSAETVWATSGELGGYDLVDGLADFLKEHGVSFA